MIKIIDALCISIIAIGAIISVLDSSAYVTAFLFFVLGAGVYELLSKLDKWLGDD